MNLISYSLFGTEPKYLVGAVRNAEEALLMYPGWRCRFYCRADDVPRLPIDRLVETGAECIFMKERWFAESLFWRFYPCGDRRVRRVIIRDVDSRFTFREREAVSAWVQSEKPFHVMRDHPAHSTIPIPGGMWGARGGCLKGIQELMEFWRLTDPVYTAQARLGVAYDLDQRFLAQMVWPVIKGIVMQHDEFSRDKWHADPWPAPVAEDGCYVGEIFDEHDQRKEGDREYRVFYANNLSRNPNVSL